MAADAHRARHSDRPLPSGAPCWSPRWCRCRRWSAGCGPWCSCPWGRSAACLPSIWKPSCVHELAHIRRHDYLVNILQSVAEALLFYHPAVWWVSGHIRSEREAVLRRCGRLGHRRRADLRTGAGRVGILPSGAPSKLRSPPTADRSPTASQGCSATPGRPSRTGLGPCVLAVGDSAGRRGVRSVRPASRAARVPGGVDQTKHCRGRTRAWAFAPCLAAVSPQ